MPRKRDLAYILIRNQDSSDESVRPSVVDEHLMVSRPELRSQLTCQNSNARIEPAPVSPSVSLGQGQRQRYAPSKPTTSKPNLRSRSNKPIPSPPSASPPFRSRYCNVPTTLDPSLRLLLELIMASEFYLNDRCEPSLGSSESTSLLIRCGLEVLEKRPNLLGKSIYWLFVDEEKKQCRICGACKSSQGRVISCIRSNLDHRPFQCLGAKSGCNRCGQESGYVIQSMTAPVSMLGY